MQSLKIHDFQYFRYSNVMDRTLHYYTLCRALKIHDFQYFRYLSVMDKTRHYYTLCRAASPIDTPPMTPTKQIPEMLHDEGVPEMEYEDEFDSGNNNLDENLEPIVEEEEVEAEAEKPTPENLNGESDKNVRALERTTKFESYQDFKGVDSKVDSKIVKKISCKIVENPLCATKHSSFARFYFLNRHMVS